jgi:hypothetical protein
LALDDKRWMFRDGKGVWGERPFTFAGWIARGVGANKTDLRLAFYDVSVADVLAQYGIDARWRPQATVTGEIRMGGSFDYPLTRYEATASSVTFDGWPSIPMSSGPMSVRGSLLAVNAEVSGSFNAKDVTIGRLKVPQGLFGVRWWREKLTVTSLDLALWGGKVDASAAYEPAEDQPYKGGALFSDVDAGPFIADALGDTGLKLEGRLDASVQTRYRDGRLRWDGRAGVHEGKLGPKGLLRAVVAEAVTAAGADAGAIEELAARHPALTTDAMPFRRLAADFQSVDDGIAVRVADIVTDGATLALDGTVDASRRLRSTGVVTLAQALTSDLVRRVPPLAKLVGGEGTLVIPVSIEGAPEDVRATLDERFVKAVAAARDGKSVEPLDTELPAAKFTTDLPPLEEQFGR